MYISKLKIKNFKCFDEVEINFDPNFNLIIGENNSGKSTIFEAMRLWQLAFQKFLKDRTNNQQSSFRVFQYFSFTLTEISFLRISDFSNLFKNRNNKYFEIALEVSDGNNHVLLPIVFSSTSKGQVINFELCKQPRLRGEVSEKLSKIAKKPLGSDFKEIFLFTYINPIFHLPSNEPHFSKGYILNKLHEAKANEVIRNLIFSISPEKKKIKNEVKHEKLVQIEIFLKEILQLKDITFSKRLEDEESYIKIFARNNIDNLEIEINQLGSGTINVLNILSVLAYGDYENFQLNSLLLDEPDSHLHFNHQSRLYKHLEKVSLENNKQIFIITHNSSLISQFDKLLSIINKEKEISPISLSDYLENHLKNIDENHYNVIKELSETKNKLISIEEDIKDDNKIYFLFEGPTDRNIFKIAYKKIYGQEFPFEIIDSISNASSVKTYLNGTNKKLGILIGVFDNDHTGRTEFGNLNKNYKIIDEITKQRENNYAFLLPIPDSRNIEFYKKNLTIEYLFKDEDLLNILGEDSFYKADKELYYKIKSEPNNHGYVIPNSLKSEISEKCESLEENSFQEFKIFFEKIAKIINYELPKTNA